MRGQIGIGLVGAGRMGSTHARILARGMPEARLVGIADVNVDAARRLAAEVDVAAVFDNAADLLASPGIDAVLIAASTNQHVPLVREAAAAGKDVLCEK